MIGAARAGRILLFLIASVDAGLHAQAAKPYLSAGVAPTLLIETEHFEIIDDQSESRMGVAIHLTGGLPFARGLALAGHATYWWGRERLEAYTVGPEFSFGESGGIRLTSAFGILRQPEGFDCAGPCPAGPSYRLRSEVGVHFGFGYRLVLRDWELGPQATWLRALAGGFRFHVLSVGVRATRQF